MEFNWDQLKREALDFEFSVVVVTAGDLPAIMNMLKNETLPGILNNAKDDRFELIISDNTKNPSSEYIDFLTKEIPKLHFPTRVFLSGDNTGCVGGWNSAFRLARGRFICGLASDYVVNTPNFLRELRAPMLEDSKLGCTGPRAARVNESCNGIPFPNQTGDYVTYIALDCLMVRKEAFDSVGWIDENIWPYQGEDQELGITLNKLGHSVMLVDLPGSVHLGQRSVHTRKDPNDDNSSMWPRSSVQSMWDRNKSYMMEKHKDFLKGRTWHG